MKKRHLFFAVFSISFSTQTSAQKVLSLDETISLAMKNNYQIIMTRESSDILKIQANRGNAGMLPQLTFNGGISRSSSNIDQQFSTGLEVKRNGVGSSTANAGFLLNWTLFDGGKMFVTYKKLLEISQQGELKVKAEIENTVTQITSVFLDIQRQFHRKNIIESMTAIYKERLDIAETRLNIGSGNKTEVLQAQLDLNEQLSAQKIQETLILTLKSELNKLIGGEEYFDFEMQDYTGTDVLDIAALEKDILEKNTELRIANSGIVQARYVQQEFKSLQYPKLAFTGGYNLVQSRSDAGFTLLNQSLGYNYGLTLSWNIFNGNSVRNSVNMASNNIQYAEANYYSQKKTFQEDFRQATYIYQQNTELIGIEKQSVKIADENVTLMMERFRNGKSTSLELKDAQNGLLQARYRLEDAYYQLKLTEIKLKKIAGNLI